MHQRKIELENIVERERVSIMVCPDGLDAQFGPILDLIGNEGKKNMQTSGLKTQNKKLNGAKTFAPAYKIAA